MKITHGVLDLLTDDKSWFIQLYYSNNKLFRETIHIFLSLNNTWKVPIDCIPALTSLTTYAQLTSRQSEHSLAQLNTMAYPYWQLACGNMTHMQLHIRRLNLGSHIQNQTLHNPWGRQLKFMLNDGAFHDANQLFRLHCKHKILKVAVTFRDCQ